MGAPFQRKPRPSSLDRTRSDVLRALAGRVRLLRAERRLSRSEVAKRSGLSVRFLARVESGDGNISLVRLASLADALGTTPDRLLREPEESPRIVALVGLRGAGKSTVGPKLSHALDLPFLEMEALIGELSGLPLDQLFEMHGERYYRRLEFEVLERIVGEGRAMVLAASGGVVNEPASWDLLLRKATVVWLRARAEDHWNRVVAQGDRRPMRDNPDAFAELRAMLASRERLYGQAHVSVTTSGRSPESVVSDIVGALRRRPRPRRPAV